MALILAATQARPGGTDRVENGADLDDAGPAYGFGLNARRRYPASAFDDVEGRLSIDWASTRGSSLLTWEWARRAARDAWERIGQKTDHVREGGLGA